MGVGRLLSSSNIHVRLGETVFVWMLYVTASVYWYFWNHDPWLSENHWMMRDDHRIMVSDENDHKWWFNISWTAPPDAHEGYEKTDEVPGSQSRQINCLQAVLLQGKSSPACSFAGFEPKVPLCAVTSRAPSSWQSEGVPPHAHEAHKKTDAVPALQLRLPNGAFRIFKVGKQEKERATNAVEHQSNPSIYVTAILVWTAEQLNAPSNHDAKSAPNTLEMPHCNPLTC